MAFDMSSEAFSASGTWNQFGQILGKEFLVEKRLEFLGDSYVVHGHEVCVSQGGFGIDMTEPFLPDSQSC